MNEKSATIENQKVTLSKQELAALMNMTVDAFREAQKDPEAEAKKLAQRERLRGEQQRQREAAHQLELQCGNHCRLDGSSAIAWARQSDGITRGVCQHCNTTFDPSHERYAELLRIPTRVANLNYF
jgi:hypothetical protein